MMGHCKDCIHEKVCELWRRRECQDASCFTDDCFEPKAKQLMISCGPEEITEEMLEELASNPPLVCSANMEPEIHPIQQWISVKDRMPEEQQNVLVFIGTTKDICVAIKSKYECNGWFSTDQCCYQNDITHWMPLPEPPEEG